jgi:hypothetical protein
LEIVFVTNYVDYHELKILRSSIAYSGGNCATYSGDTVPPIPGVTVPLIPEVTVPLIPEVIVPLFMMLTSLKKMSDGRTKNKHHGIKAINTFKKRRI